MARTRKFEVLGAALLLALAGSAASAQEFCVMCSGPEANYRCLIGGDVPAGARLSRGQFLCITELARAGGHASCSAARAQATPCPGETRTVMFPPGELGVVPPAFSDLDQPPSSPLPPSDGGLSPAPVGPPELPPQHATNEAEQPLPDPAQPSTTDTLAEKTGKALQDTGEAVGGAVKKTWDCVISLFGDC